MSELYLGLISGTSMDGVDAALVEFGDRRCDVIAAGTFGYPPAIAGRLQELVESPKATLAELGALDVAVGRFFADCALALIRGAELEPGAIKAIGHHGQTVFHKPGEPEPFTMQLGDPASVAAITGIATVADLRALDIALGGQGAPLVPAFHGWLFRSETTARVVANVGGIANLTTLLPGEPTRGFDTGPGNTLLDFWVRTRLDRPFDDRGRWAATGRCDDELLAKLLDEPYFAAPPPKSTGRELFNSTWLQGKLDRLSRSLPAEDVQASLVELTAATIAEALRSLDVPEFELIVCGGGAHNDFLLSRVAARIGREARTTAALGLDPDWVEAAAFAWLARARLENAEGNVPSVTGARQSATLGGLYLAPSAGS